MELKVERLSYGPDAIAHDGDGRTVFVAGGVPGDVVEATITKEERTWAKATVDKVVSLGAVRVESRCPYAGVCGGCPWATVARDAQIEAKRANVVDSLRRIGGWDPDEAEALVGPCESPGPDWGYRNKIELGVAESPKGPAVGMHPTKGARLVKVDRCLLLEPSAAKLVKQVEGGLSYLAHSRDLALERVGIRTSARTKSTEIALWGRPGPFPRAQASRVLADGPQVTSLVRVLMKGKAKARKVGGTEVLKGDGFWRERVLDAEMAFSAPSFFQVNTPGAERLVSLVMEGLAPTDAEDAMDLYCGAGTFTLPLAGRSAWVDAVEAYGPAVRDLRRNLQWNGTDNVEVTGGDANREFPLDPADVVVVDPPRAGLEEPVVEKLSALDARTIAYVSCDPATLARDLKRFRERGAYTVRSITPVDLFPQTFHVEDVCILDHR